MDLNKDGHLDVISGSYRAGVYGKPTSINAPMHIFWGSEDGKFSLPKTLLGSDKKLLAMNSSKGEKPLKGQTLKSCPFPVDLNGDGNLDIVSGNAAGTFAFYPAKGNVKYDPEPTWLKTENGELLKVEGGDSGPVFTDWDSDGDMDMLSGSLWGNVYLFTNTGTKTDPKFSAPVSLITKKPSEEGDGFPDKVGTDHIKQPNVSWRVAVADVNGDEKLDIIVGDRQFLTLANEGVEESVAKEKLLESQAGHEILDEATANFDFDNEENWTEEQKKSWEDYLAKADALDSALAPFIVKRASGFVWAYIRK